VQVKHDAEISAPVQSRSLDVVVASSQSSTNEAATKEHYWGQALQYLDHKVEVRGCGARFALAAPKSHGIPTPCATAGARRSEGDGAVLRPAG
jgi:hypothetical protein